jgi:acylphosphatase
MSGRSDGVEFRRYRVVGRVQGVGFRWWTRKVADELGVVGRVRNDPDGSVNVRAGGHADALARLEEALRRGPPVSRVDDVYVENLVAGADGVPRDVWDDFAIDG